MSDRFGLMGLATVESQYLDGRPVLNCSDVTAAAVDEEVRRILEESYKEAKRILSENMDALDVIADFLIRQETITGKEFMKMFDTVRAARKASEDGTPSPEEENPEVSDREAVPAEGAAGSASVPAEENKAGASAPAEEKEDSQSSLERDPFTGRPVRGDRTGKGRYSQVSLEDLDLFDK